MSQSIDSKTIARIFHELAFQHDDTRISDAALSLSSQYIRLFINEAVLRANEERLAEGVLQVDGIDNIDEPRRAESRATEAEVPDVTLADDDELASNPPTQFDQPSEPDEHSLDTRHLAKVAGVLMLDF